MLSRGVVPPDSICIGSNTSIINSPNWGMLRASVATKLHFRHAVLLRIEILHDRHGHRFQSGELLLQSGELLTLRRRLFRHPADIMIRDRLLLRGRAFVCCGSDGSEHFRRQIRDTLHARIIRRGKPEPT